MTQTDGKIYYMYEWKELILLKGPYCPRWSTHSMRYLSKYEWHFFSHRTRIDSFKICSETQSHLLNSKNNLEQEQEYHTLCFQTVLQSYSNQNSMAMVQKQTHRSVEQSKISVINPYLCGQLIYDKWG